MSIERKIVLICVAVFSLYGLMNYGLYQSVIAPSFAELEQEQAQRDLDRCIQALGRERHHLELFNHDWSAWDDMHAYAETPNAEFERHNLTPNPFTDYNINLFYIFNTAGEVVWGRHYNLRTRTPEALPDFPDPFWDNRHPLIHRATEEDTLSGLVLTSRGPALIASRPILDSFQQGPITGTLLTGRMLDESFLALLVSQTQVALEVRGMDELDGEWREAAEALLRLPLRRLFHHAAPGMLHAYAMLDDVYGEPALVLRAEIPRTITERGATATQIYFVLSAIAGFATLAMLLMLGQRVITGPLARLTAHATGIQRTDELRTLDLPRRGDEVGMLAGAFDGMVARIQDDLRERERAERALRDSEATLRAIVEAAPDAILMVDPGLRIETANPAAERIFECPAAELTGETADALLTPESAARFAAAAAARFERAGAHPEPAALEIDVQRRLGGATPAHVTMNVLLLEKRRILVCIFRDISDIKRMHARLIESQHLAELGELGASIAHEIRNPLAGISGVIQVLRSSLHREDWEQEALGEALAQVERVELTVKQLLTYAKPWQPSFQQGDLADFLQGFCGAWQGDPAAGGCACKLESSIPLTVPFDPALLEIVLGNLVQNACDAMDGRGEVRVALDAVEDTARIHVLDTGRGFNPAIETRLFEPFFTTKTRGTGLGLAICRRVVEAHAGSIRILNRTGGGAEVIVSLPMKE